MQKPWSLVLFHWRITPIMISWSICRNQLEAFLLKMSGEWEMGDHLTTRWGNCNCSPKTLEKNASLVKSFKPSKLALAAFFFFRISEHLDTGGQFGYLSCHLCANATWVQAEKKKEEIATKGQNIVQTLWGSSVGPWTLDTEVCMEKANK